MSAPTAAQKRAKAQESKARDRQVQNLERALKEERTGLVAVARAFLEVSGEHSGTLLRRLEVMVRQAEATGASPRARDAIGYGHAVLARAREQMQGRPQELFDPHVGHVSPTATEKLAAPVEHQQIGLGYDESAPLEDVRLRAEQERAAARTIQDTVIMCYEARGALTDKALHVEYCRRTKPLKRATVVEARTALVRLGRIVKDGTNPIGETQWTLLERKK